MRIISFVSVRQVEVIEGILNHLEEPTREERATGPPEWVKQAEVGQGDAEYADTEVSDESYLVDTEYGEGVEIGT